MEKDSAIKIASLHLANLNVENRNTDITFTIDEPQITELGFYFEYKYELKNPNSTIRISGAPGFIVNNEGEIEIVSWDRLNSLKLKE